MLSAWAEEERHSQAASWLHLQRHTRGHPANDKSNINNVQSFNVLHQRQLKFWQRLRKCKHTICSKCLSLFFPFIGWYHDVRILSCSVRFLFGWYKLWKYAGEMDVTGKRTSPIIRRFQHLTLIVSLITPYYSTKQQYYKDALPSGT